MDDPQLQRAIYASIQTARSQGYQLNKGSGQTFRPSINATRGSGGSHASNTTRMHHAAPNSNRSQPASQGHGRVYSGSSLPGMGAGANSSSLRVSYGRIESLRRDGIVPASSGPLGPPASTAGHYHPRQQPVHHPSSVSPSSRALPTAVPPRLPATATTPTRLRNQQHHQIARNSNLLRQHPDQQHQQQGQQGPLAVDRRRPGMRQPLQVAPTNPVLEAIAAVSAEAHSAFETALASGGGVAAALAASSAASAPPSLSPHAKATSPKGATTAAAVVPGAVGGNAPPPRTLVPLATPGGSVVMVPEGVDPLLAQAVLREAVTWDTGVTFDDIAGCNRAKQLLHEAVALPLIIPEFFTGIREPWRGVLLHGPPGNGKTMLAKAVAGMVGGAFFAVSPASLTSKWRGESEKLLAALFAVAQAHAPAIIFIDEVDALGGARGADGEHEASRRFKAELLQQMDGLASGRGVMVLAATNCPWDLDPALRRRLEKRIHIGLPDRDQRQALLALHLRGVALAADVDLAPLAAACEGFSGADIRLLCRDAAMAPLRRQIGGLTLTSSSAPTPATATAAPTTAATANPATAATAVPAQPPSPSSSTPPASPSPSPQPPSQTTTCQPSSAQPQPPPAQPPPLVLRSAADIRRMADSGELARGAVVSAADLELARGSVRPSVSAEQAARYVQWDAEFAST